ncbi:MAG: DNA polymerase I, partial [Halobacteriaceae archaeon]
MVFKIDFLDETVLEWTVTANGAEVTEQHDYTPRFYLASRTPDMDIDFDRIRSFYADHPDVVTTAEVERRPGFRREYETVLAVDVTHIDRVTPL